MIALGPFRFDVDHLACQELMRSSGYTWAELPVVGGRPALQYTGRETDTMSLPGVFYPHYKGGLAQLPAMRLAAEQGIPFPVVTLSGWFFGLWTIARIEETQGVFFVDGTPRKVDFVIELKQYASPTDLAKVAISSALGVISRLFQ